MCECVCVCVCVCVDKTVNRMLQNFKTCTYNVLYIWNLGAIVSMDDCTCNCLIKYIQQCGMIYVHIFKVTMKEFIFVWTTLDVVWLVVIIVYIAWFCLLIFSIGCPDKYKVWNVLSYLLSTEASDGHSYYYFQFLLRTLNSN